MTVKELVSWLCQFPGDTEIMVMKERKDIEGYTDFTDKIELGYPDQEDGGNIFQCKVDNKIYFGEEL